MNLQLAEQHKLIVERCKDLLQVVFIEDKDIVKEIMNKSQLKVEEYNNENSIVINPTKYELSTFKSTAKRVVNGKYANVFIKTLEKPKYEDDYLDYLCDKEKKEKHENITWDYEYYNPDSFCDKCKEEFYKRQKSSYEFQDEKSRIINEFQNACENTYFEDDLKLRSISLSRSIVFGNPTELQKVLKKKIHQEILLAFEQQNKELLKKYNF
jgi:hypothetical protein